MRSNVRICMCNVEDVLKQRLARDMPVTSSYLLIVKKTLYFSIRFLLSQKYVQCQATQSLDLPLALTQYNLALAIS